MTYRWIWLEAEQQWYAESEDIYKPVVNEEIGQAEETDYNKLFD